jgi:cephalosporin hydroxylase
MKLVIDTTARTITIESAAGVQTHGLYTKEAFELISREWLRVGIDQHYSYTFSWMGRPIIQLPEDLIRIQEVLYRVRPDVIVETGIAHGGSLVYYASLCKAMDHGRVIGVDVALRRHNREAIEAHALSPWITLVEGDSTDSRVVERVRSLIAPGETVLVVLDSNHASAHVAAELEAYHPLVTAGSYIVATDGVMQIAHDVPSGKPEWEHDHPAAAAADFARRHPEFVLEQPAWPFNESTLSENVTHWAGAWLRRAPNP